MNLNSNWEIIRAIPEEAMKKLALEYAPNLATSAKLLRYDSGVNNCVAIIQYDTGIKVCIRIPLCGWGEKWTQMDAEALCSSIERMKYVRKHTNLSMLDII